MLRKVVLGFVLLSMIFSAQVGWGADDLDDDEKVYAVQNRLFHRNHEIATNIGYIADDPFFQVFPISIGYTYNFNESFGWEVGRVQYLFTQERGLQDQLRNPPFNAQAEFFLEPKYMLNSHLVWKPFYGKSAFMNRGVINHETYFLAGSGVTRYERTFSTGETETEDAVNLSFGAGFKYFLNQKFCINVEVREVMNFRSDDTENNLFFGIGLGWRFNLAPRKIEEDPTMKKLDEILSE